MTVVIPKKNHPWRNNPGSHSTSTTNRNHRAAERAGKKSYKARDDDGTHNPGASSNNPIRYT